MYQNGEGEGNVTISGRESGAGDEIFLDLCKPLYKERGNVVDRRLDDDTERIHKEGGDKKE